MNAHKPTVVNKSCRPEPELSAAFACGVHHTEVIDSCPQHSTVSGAQFCYAAQQDLHPLSCKPKEEQFKRHISTLNKKIESGPGHTRLSVATHRLEKYNVKSERDYQCLVEVIFAPLVSEEYLSQDSILIPLSNRKALR